MKTLISISLFLLLLNPAYSVEIFFVELKKDVIEIGEYDEQYVKQPFSQQEIEKLDLNEAVAYLANSDQSKSQRTLYFFHALYGNFRPVHKKALKHLDTYDGFDRVICIEWHAEALWYTHTWKKAFHQGQRLGDLMNALLSRNENTILCQSAGNRIFEGLAFKLEKDSKIDKIMLAAADLGVDCFEGGKTLKKLDDCEIIIYVNEKDKLLQLSKIAHGNKRLGLNGDEEEIKQQYELFQIAEVINVTEAVNTQFIPKGHTYFKNNKIIAAEIKERLEQL